MDVMCDIEKPCSKCRVSKSLDHYHLSTRGSHGRQPVCKPCRKVIDTEYYSADRKAKKDGNKRRAESLRREIGELKRSLGCLVCCENNPACLDFHHFEKNKSNNVSTLLGTGRSKLMRREIEKCFVLCANCHRKLHAGIFSLLIQKILPDRLTR